MTLRILSYNILEGGKDRLPVIGGVILQQQPDVVALQEALTISQSGLNSGEEGCRLRMAARNSLLGKLRSYIRNIVIVLWE